jgi:hypothetical protein
VKTEWKIYSMEQRERERERESSPVQSRDASQVDSSSVAVRKQSPQQAVSPRTNDL